MKPWTQEEVEHLHRRVAEGASVKDVAIELGRTYQSVVGRAARDALTWEPKRGLPPLSKLAMVALRNGPMRKRALAAHLGIAEPNIYRVLAPLRKTGQVYILKYERTHSGPACPVYVAGTGVDAPKLRKLSHREINGAYRKRKREEAARRPRITIRADFASAWMFNATKETTEC